jgi:hypothetical protein
MFEPIKDPEYYELQEYRKLGAVKEITLALEKAEELLLQYQKLGTPDEIFNVFDSSEKLLNKYKNLLDENKNNQTSPPPINDYLWDGTLINHS